MVDPTHLWTVVFPLVIAFVSGRIYAIVGGDEWVERHFAVPKRILHVIHHWQFVFLSMGIGVAYALGLETTSPTTELLLFAFWLGIGLFLEDFTYHIAHGGWRGMPRLRRRRP